MATHRYLVLQRCAPAQQAASPSASPAELEALYASFQAWKDRFTANLVDIGGRLRPGGKVLSDAGVKDGPLIESKELIAGYMILSAESWEQAVEIARACPGVGANGTTAEIREIAGP